MGDMTPRIGASIAACGLVLHAAAAIPGAPAAPPVTLPAMTSGGGGPIIGGGDADAQYRISRQLTSLGRPDVQEVDGSDAGPFNPPAAAVPDRQLAAPFALLQRALTCQVNNAGFGARAYRRNDGRWGGAT